MLCPMIDPETNALLFMDFSGSKTYKLSLSKDQIILEEVEKLTYSDFKLENILSKLYKQAMISLQEMAEL